MSSRVAPQGVIDLATPTRVPGFTARYATADDWAAVAQVLNASHQADGVDEVRTADDIRAEYEPLDEFTLGRDLVLGEVDGEPVAMAFGILVERDGALTAELFGAVTVPWRRQGIGTSLFSWNRDRLAAQAATDPRPGPRELRTYCLDIEEAHRGLIDAEGFVPIRYGFEMRRSLTGALPVAPMPDGLELRPVTPDVERAIFEADNEAFEDHWGHRPQGEGDFVARFRHPDVDTSLWRVAWDGDEVAGVVMNAIFKGENEALGVARGWLDHVSVRRAWRGRGLAKALCARSFEALRDAGMTEAWLGVDGTNPTGALQLYEGLGFRVARRWQAFGRPLSRPAWPGWTQGAGDEPPGGATPNGSAI